MGINDILRKLGISELNEMQQHAVEAITGSDGDVVLLSPTGTGKTLAYLLPVVQLIERIASIADSPDGNGPGPLALVVTPGRELAQQSDQVLKRMGCAVRSVACYGGRAAMDEHRMLRDTQPHIIFGTPGRLNDHLDKGNIDRYHIRFLIIDEFDKCLEMGFQGEMQRLLKNLPGLERRILLSATKAEQIPQFVNMSKKGTLIDYLPDDDQTAAERVEVYQVRSPQKDKLDTLRRLLLTFGQESSIVFLNYRDSVERTNNYLREQGFVTSLLHGGLEQRQREEALYKFSNGSANILVATDLASRGLDIPDVSNVIHYHLPETEEAYIHRTGRTARWDASGRTFFLLGPGENTPEYIDAATIRTYEFPSSIGAGQGISLPRMATLYIGKGKKDKVSKGDIVGFLCKQGGLTTDQIGRIDVRDRYAYVAVSRDTVSQVLTLAKGAKIKGIKTVVEPVR